MLSVFDIFKIGIGPSSSHTVGPMKAAKEFTDDLIAKEIMHSITAVKVDVYGSLSWTGKGHHTDIAILMGLGGYLPESVDIDLIPSFMTQVKETSLLPLAKNQHMVSFPESAFQFHNEVLPLHENGMQIHAFAGDNLAYSKTYYSIGGGFIVDEENFGKEQSSEFKVPYAFSSAQDLIDLSHKHQLSIAEMMLANERVARSDEAIHAGLAAIWNTMKTAIERGCNTTGVLAGPLKVNRRAHALHQRLTQNTATQDPLHVMDWINVFALAVSEENAAGGRIVTSPTNGAAGIIPAVLAYFDKFIESAQAKHYEDYLLTAAAIGILYKNNASISGAEVGCQGEVGVSSSMAAAGLAHLLTGSTEQVIIAAEIGMEHHLGLTCDPVAGQVQVPCIERNAIASVKAVNSARMALQRESQPRVSLDSVIATMYETGKDMNAKYRETSRGGLAINVMPIEC
jgi:L-serine dehydratase